MRTSSRGAGGRPPAPAGLALLDRAEFIDQWNGLGPAERRKIRRLVRIGAPMQGVADVPLALGYVDWQRSRPWARYFWLWFVPGVVLALGAAMQVHPIALGVVLAAAGQALVVRRNIRRVALVNRPLSAVAQTG